MLDLLVGLRRAESADEVVLVEPERRAGVSESIGRLEGEVTRNNDGLDLELLDEVVDNGPPCSTSPLCLSELSVIVVAESADGVRSGLVLRSGVLESGHEECGLSSRVHREEAFGVEPGEVPLVGEVRSLVDEVPVRVEIGQSRLERVEIWVHANRVAGGPEEPTGIGRNSHVAGPRAAVMDVRVHPGPLSGRVQAPPSKSYTHRALLAAGLGDGERLRGPLRSADTEATARAISAFGGNVTWAAGEETATTVSGVSGALDIPADVIDCANSGTTMRLSTAVAGLVDGTTVLTGDDSLKGRPQGPLLEAITQLGGEAESSRGTGEPPLVVRGPIHGGRVAIPGDVSSQFVTALLMAGALTEEGVSVDLTTPLKSTPYVEITLEVLDAFGVSATETHRGYKVAGDQDYDAGGEYAVPGDFSSISYLLAAGAIAASDGLTIAGAVPSAQGDTAIVDVVQSLGGFVDWDRGAAELSVSAAPLDGITVDVADTPDLLPTIAALGAVADGTTHITDCEHVRYKETDRVAVMAEELEQLGAVVEEHSSELVVHGGESDLAGTTVAGHGDHRIIMALAVAALGAAGPTTITGAGDVAVSFPKFFETLATLGATVDSSD